jgi:hypothetical protein
VAPEWTLTPGDRIRRTDLHARFGGGGRGGMEPSAKTPNVFLFTSEEGKKHGYPFDGWDGDGTFHYTGEGRTGDQQMREGNKAARDHLADGRALRLFEKAGTDVVYMGEFSVPDESHVLVDEARDVEDVPRSVFVFRLRPVGDTWAGTQSAAPGHELSIEIPLEAKNVARYIRQRQALEPITVLRREAALVERYAAWLSRRRGVEAVRNLVATPAGQAMYTDLFVPTGDRAGELIEAKASGSRQHVRMALGQILDYARYVDHTALAVLTPSRPAPDMVALLIAHGVGAIWESAPGDFHAERPRSTSG